MKNNRIKVLIVLLFTICLIVGCDFFDDGSKPKNASPKAKNTILFIGDGMGLEHRKAARWLTVGMDGFLSMDDMPVEGDLRTGSYDNLVTDSAAAATAIASGEKTNNGVVGLSHNLGLVNSILEKAILAGKSVGLVTTTHITHATPAAFASHVESRGLMTEIAEQMLIAGVDVLLGGGEDEFIPTSENGCYSEPGERSDGKHLINEAIAVGYVFVCNSSEFDLIEASSVYRLLGLFSDEGMPRPHSPSLAAMTKKAIEILSHNPEGFFLMVEGGQIDWASHSNDAESTIRDTIDFDSAVKIGKQFYLHNDSTLVIVTADHETGGMSVSLASSGMLNEDGPFFMPDGQKFYVNWSTTGHTAANVPITAMGPRAAMFYGTNDNTFVHDVILSVF